MTEPNVTPPSWDDLRSVREVARAAWEAEDRPALQYVIRARAQLSQSTAEHIAQMLRDVDWTSRRPIVLDEGLTLHTIDAEGHVSPPYDPVVVNRSLELPPFIRVAFIAQTALLIAILLMVRVG